LSTGVLEQWKKQNPPTPNIRLSHPEFSHYYHKPDRKQDIKDRDKYIQ
jgi:hypothetical protein